MQMCYACTLCHSLKGCIAKREVREWDLNPGVSFSIWERNVKLAVVLLNGKLSLLFLSYMLGGEGIILCQVGASELGIAALEL